MKKFLIRISILIVILYGVVIATNYVVDPANLFTNEIIEDAVNKLSTGKTVEFYGDFDEGIFQEKMVSRLKEKPDTVIIGSSQIMYANWNYKNSYIGYLSSANMGDYFGMVGILDELNKMPEHIVFGIDPWAFMFDHNGASHKSVRVYAEKIYSKVKGESYNPDKHFENNLNKIKEVFSFPYFQSSIWAIRENGLRLYISGDRKKVKTAKNDEIGDIAKIMPNGRGIMSRSLLHTVADNDREVLSAIKYNVIYKFGKSLEHLDKNNFNEFVELVDYLNNIGVKVDIYLPSRYPTLYEYLVNNKDYGVVEELEKEVRNILGGGYGITIHGSYNPFLADVKKEDYADWNHLKSEEAAKNYEFILEY